jgi:transposase
MMPARETERMMKLQDVILKAMARRLSWAEAAEIAGMSVRNMQCMRERYQEHGYNGLFDQRRGKRSIHRVPMETVEKVLGLYRDKYPDCNVRHFHEKLKEVESIALSYSWVKQALQGAGLVAKRRKFCSSSSLAMRSRRNEELTEMTKAAWPVSWSGYGGTHKHKTTLLFLLSATLVAQQPLFRVVDLDVGARERVEVSDGKGAIVKLLSMGDTRDRVRSAIRDARVEVEINGARTIRVARIQNTSSPNAVYGQLLV